ncbi:MAG: hypothetical protein R2849_10080 [Thermomicrobiales bacterium]
MRCTATSFIVKSDVEALLDATGAGVFVIAPDRKRIGTNAIAVRRADPVPLRFGFDSYARHLDAATSAGTLVRECGAADWDSISTRPAI